MRKVETIELEVVASLDLDRDKFALQYELPSSFARGCARIKRIGDDPIHDQLKRGVIHEFDEIGTRGSRTPLPRFHRR